MNIYCWNCRGPAAKGFTNLIRDMRFDYNFSFLILVETHLSGTNANCLFKRLNFDDRFII